MADHNMPIEGKDTSISISVNGQMVNVIDQVTNFSAEQTHSQREHRPLVTARVYRDLEPEGWSGTIEVAIASPDVDEVIDRIDAAKRAGIPVVINIRDRTRYRNGTSKTYLYPRCELGYSRSATRGESTTVSLAWETGEARIAL